MSFKDRLMNGFNAFMNKDPTYRIDTGLSNYARPDRIRLTRGNERSIITSVYNRISLDCSSIDIKHVRLNDEERYVETENSGLNNCLTVEANIDQTGRALIQDIVMSMFNEGVVAVIPVDTNVDPKNGSYDILTLRTAKIVEWYPRHVKVNAYNDRIGKHEELILPKLKIAIIENPMYAVMNEPNSTAQRLIRKLALLDHVDEMNGSGKLDLIIQLPYQIKTEARRIQANNRRKDIIEQLSSSQLGIAYTDGTEKVTQLNRPIENQLMSQIETLTRMLYSQLGLTEEIMNGTADESVMTNYFNRTIEPIMSSIVEELKRKFLTKTARTQGQTIQFFRDPFKLMPVTSFAELADKLTRNEIMSSNEIRQIIGIKPSDDPRADQLINSNISQSKEDPRTGGTSPLDLEEGAEEQENYEENNYDGNSKMLDSIDSNLDELENLIKHDDFVEIGNHYLMHYSSPYYDPVKAHEYYMEYTKNKKLKGREKGTGEDGETEYSTSSLNEQGKMAYKQIKENLRNEKNNKLKSNQAAVKSKNDSDKKETDERLKTEKDKVNSEIKSHASAMASEIVKLQESIKKINKNDPKGDRGRVNAIIAQIDKLRKDNAEKRDSLNKAYQNTAASIRSEHKNKSESNSSSNKSSSDSIRKEYSQKEKDELKKLIESGEFRKTKKKKSTSS